MRRGITKLLAAGATRGRPLLRRLKPLLLVLDRSGETVRLKGQPPLVNVARCVWS